MKEILVLELTPQELKEMIHITVKAALSEFKEELRPKEPEELLTRKEVVKLLQISLTTLYHWTRDGKLKQYKTGGKVYYKKNEVLTALES
ncbi:helix-turn-helix domain-containing protein [Sunxiuqinia sp. A32]|uniref:helix-turn-helix domain-containing protein n=1 Tax=Sunxiuqinia sp. A32 TaxID=3461496 RepID=UPI0040466314